MALGLGTRVLSDNGLLPGALLIALAKATAARPEAECGDEQASDDSCAGRLFPLAAYPDALPTTPHDQAGSPSACVMSIGTVRSGKADGNRGNVPVVGHDGA